ncbi:mycofactocin-coupled SDR family oxidoreductase [Citricoccus nitrophenolicus]|uniref:SDR family mycofactocin-dependent oxidoreductase n=1 Tax=Citricoccus muralis TaxID=169134 RepID=A0A3D9LCL2_9MICC|nr:mycofactocin-coupled SDR family oxidoreductase [Citricoccus muralis]REE02923.1 SDR family mycofactocin-dependent oxidoreductase [Citricoccus muralis]
MVGRLEGKVALISGGARGQGRSHAVRLAEEGADIITFDVCGPIDGVPYPAPNQADLDETVRQVEALDRRIVARQADVRDYAAVKAVVDEGVAELGGRLDIVSASAGIFTFGPLAAETTEEDWDTMLDINLKGVWQTVKAATPHMIAADNGGSVVLTSSTAGIKGTYGVAAYTAAKHGVVGLMKTLALELGPQNIRVNSVHPTSVATPMVLNDALYNLFSPDSPTEESFRETMHASHALNVGIIEAVDISNAILWLSTDEARYVTGTQIKVDAGYTTK